MLNFIILKLEINSDGIRVSFPGKWPDPRPTSGFFIRFPTKFRQPEDGKSRRNPKLLAWFRLVDHESAPVNLRFSAITLQEIVLVITAAEDFAWGYLEFYLG